MIKKESKKGNIKAQVTIWIIIAIVIVAAVIILFALRVPQRIFIPSAPAIQLKDCVDSKLKEAIEKIGEQGGSINPINVLSYKGERVEYLCYTNQYYKTCVNQQPLLKQHIEREILQYIEPEAKTCIKTLKNDLRSKGYNVVENKEDISVEIVPNNVKVAVSGFSVTRADTSERYEKFELSKKSEIYDLIMLANSILNWEARYGDSDITTYMLYYPDIKVEKYKQEDGSKIYILTNTNSKDKFVFATRSLSWPAGYGLGQTYKPIIS